MLGSGQDQLHGLGTESRRFPMDAPSRGGQLHLLTASRHPLTGATAVGSCHHPPSYPSMVAMDSHHLQGNLLWGPQRQHGCVGHSQGLAPPGLPHQ